MYTSNASHKQLETPCLKEHPLSNFQAPISKFTNIIAYNNARFHKLRPTIKHKTLECGPMPNVMAALPNIGGALYGSLVIPFLVPRRKVWLTPAAGMPCSNTGNIRERKTWT